MESWRIYLKLKEHKNVWEYYKGNWIVHIGRSSKALDKIFAIQRDIFAGTTCLFGVAR